MTKEELARQDSVRSLIETLRIDREKAKRLLPILVSLVHPSWQKAIRDVFVEQFGDMTSAGGST